MLIIIILIFICIIYSIFLVQCNGIYGGTTQTSSEKSPDTSKPPTTNVKKLVQLKILKHLIRN